MEALYYETIIRWAHGVGRYGIPAANADVYRSFDRAYTLLHSERQLVAENKPKQWGASVEELKSEFQIEAGRVSTNLQDAIAAIRKKYALRLTTTQQSLLDDAAKRLVRPTYESIRKTIDVLSDFIPDQGADLK